MSQEKNTNDGLIDNNNHIIPSIRNHECRIQRQEQHRKELKKHIRNLKEMLTKKMNSGNSSSRYFQYKF